MKAGAVLMASGAGRRFGGNKLLCPVDGVPMVERAMEAVPAELFERACVVSRYPEILALAEARGYVPVPNPDAAQGQSASVRLGLGELLELVGLYQQQMELFEQWTLGQEHETGDAGKEAWQQQLSMLKGKIAAESRLCAIEMTGFAGEMVDYRLHEVLQADEPETREQEGTIAKVHSQGMIYQGTVVRKARVTAYRKA